MQMMKIRYVGKGDCFLIEYNGRKYSVSKTQPVLTVPLDVYNYIQSNMGMFRGDIIPFHDDSPELKEDAKKTIEEDINDMERDIAPMKKVTSVEVGKKTEVKEEVSNESKKRRSTRRRSRSTKSSTRNL